MIKHNPQHHSIDWIILPLNSLPVDGVSADLQVIETVTNPEENVNKVNYLSDTESLNKYQTVSNEDDEVYDHKTDTSTFLPHGKNDQLEQGAIHSKLGTKISWLAIEDQPLNEYTTPFLATMAFPCLCLFRDGKGDPTNPS